MCDLGIRHKLATAQENLSLGFPIRWYSNQPAQLQILAGKFNFARSKSRYGTF